MVSHPAAVGLQASSALNSRFELFVASLPGFPEAGLPIAGSRAGAVGLLDLRHVRDFADATSEIDRLAALGGTHQGLILRADDEKSLGEIAARLPAADSIVLAAGELAWPQAIAAVRPLCRRVGCLVHSSAQAEAALAAGADYLIARGYEAGGEVGEETTFVLLQRLLADFQAPIIAWGGIGFFTAAACQAAGAAGVVLDWQLALLPESPLSPALKRKLNAADGSESHAVRLPNGSYLRFFSTPGDNQRSEIEAFVDGLPADADMAALQAFLAERLAGEDADRRLLLAGQDCGFAKLWAKRARSVGRAVEALFASISGQLEGAAKSAALSDGAPCAVSHGTRYPIVQGPMTRVSDVPEFCDAVERGGALPFLALALMRGEELRKLLADSKKLLGSRPWGVGILGFMPHDLRSEQLAAILEVKPPFAVIAGGRPDQAAAFEDQGITTYLHVPSPGMLSTFVAEGARRFVFEGRECGGHVGPRTSFVLWESMLQAILDAGLSAEEFAKLHVLFAGGIHDGRSAAAVAAMAQPLVERGAKIGALLGTAYLFTEEIVLSGATLDGYRSVAIEAAHTVLVETGPGHAIRCADTEYVRFFEGERQRLKQQPNASHESIRDELEQMNLGRLRAASKGIVRGAKGKDSVAGLVSIDEPEQRRQGMYMLGQISALRRERVTIAALHEQVSTDYQKFLGIEPAYPVIREQHQPDAPATFDVAIVGMSCLVPGATDLGTFWRNVLGKKDLIGEIPPDRFEVDRWFNSDRQTRDKFYSRWGGFIPDIPFDPLQFGIPPSTLKSIEPMQLLALELIRRAMLDAGYDQENPHRARTSVILGVGGGSAELGASYAFRAMLPQFIENPDETLWSQLPEWTEDSFAGILLNVVAGRASNRFDFGGANFTVDAACASSLAALYLACRELSEGSADMVVAGGCDTVQNPLGYMCFAKAGALSPRGRSRAFDASADGIAISEGHAAIVLKRREDAERNGDHIYAVIRAVAAGSDGRSKGLTAPRAEGQLRTLERAYAQARFSPATVDLFEAHGTGTAVGDQTECLALVELLEKRGALDKSAAIGSIKSMIGHTKCAAGMVGLVKTALALETHVLPPTLHVEKPNPKARLDQGPVYVNSDSRPWIRGEFPRRAGVSSFGFGGSNFHTVLEEYEGAARPLDQSPTGGEWPTELFAFSGNTAAALATSIRGTLRSVAKLADAAPDAREKLLNLAASCAQRCSAAADVQRAALIAEDFGTLRERLEELAQLVEKQTPSVSDWLFYAPHRLGTAGQIAFLFPGQGSQSPNMLRDLALEFGEVAEAFQLADRVLPAPGARSLSSYVFPPSSFTDEERKQTVEQLKSTDVAQPALGACALGLQRLLAACGLRPAATAGHSYGELAAFQAAGAYDEATLLRISAARGRAMAAAGKAAGDAGQMRVVRAGANEVQAALAGLPDVWIANYNSPRQVVISGTTPGVAAAVAALDQAKLASVAIPVACAFHTPLVRPASEQLATAIGAEQVSPPRVPVYSNVSAAAWTGGAQGVGETLAKQVESPVRFADMIRAMYDAGTRLFVEVGPGQVLSGLVKDTLTDRAHLALPVDGRGVHGLTQLQRVLCQTFVHGAAIRFDRLFSGRIGRAAPATPDINNLPKHYWLINSAYVRPASEPARIPSPKARLGVATTAPAVEATRAPAMPPAAPAALPVAPAAPTPLPASPSTQPAMSNGSPAPRFQPPAPTPAPIETIAADDAYGAFQATMRHFLDTQRAVMGAFFGASPEPVEHAPRAIEYHAHSSTNGAYGAAIPAATVAPAAPVPVPAAPVATIGAASAHPAPPVVQTPTAPAPVAPAPMAVAAAAPAPAVVVAQELDLPGLLIGIVSDRTGYPAEMLELETNLEADLGIDSIKRVEIIAAFRGVALPEMKEPPSAFMERMTAARNMRAIVDTVREFAGLTSTAVAASATLAPVVVAQASAVSVSELETMLAGIVTERTGYPTEMLEMETNLEADLGIDSIKRVEIIAAFRRVALPEMKEPPSAFMERMTAARNMRTIVDTVLEFSGSSDPAPVVAAPVSQPAAKPSAVVPPLAESAHCDRCVAAPVECEPAKLDSAALRQRVSAGVTLVAGGPHALAAVVRERIERAGGVVALLPEELLRSPEALLAGIETIRRDQGRIVGALHLAGLTDAEEFPQISEAAWLERCRIELRSLLPLLQALQAELTADPSFPVLAATLGGGDFLADGADEARHPWRGGAAGFIKTAAKEWPEALLRAVDFDLQPEAEALLAEWLAAGPVEIGYRRAHRWTIAPVLSNLPQLDADVAAAAVELDAQSVVLATGGARGITAQIVLEIAERTQATCVLLGRSPLPASVEGPSTANLSDPMALRQALIAEAKASGKPASPREIEGQLRSLLAARELRETLGGIQRAGGQVDYIPCDVRDVAALLEIVRNVRQRYGRIDCVIHGAGVIEDRYIRDKTVESFDRVIDTKVQSLLAICRELDDAPPKQLVIFSSSSGFFGNPGQCDYAAGNEILNRLGRRLQARWPAAHVMSFNWGPWTGAGMVTPEVAHQMQTRGVELVTVPAGRSLVWREMVTGRNEGVRIVGGSGFWTDEAKTLAAAECALPLCNSLLPNRVRRTHADCFEAHVTLDAGSHAYLADHQLDGKPVLPFAVALEMMAQTAAAAEPRWHVVAVEQLRLFQGVVLEETHRQLVLRADLLQRSATRSKWRVRMIDPMAGARPLYEANVSLASEAPVPPAAPEPPALAGTTPPTVDTVYQTWLFHGPRFQVLKTLLGLDATGIDAMVSPSAAHDMLSGGVAADWLIDPIALDAAPQLAIVWARSNHDVTPLPNRSSRYLRYAPLAGGPVELRVRVAAESSGAMYKADAWFIRDGKLLGHWQGLEGAGSAALNLLMAGAR